MKSDVVTAGNSKVHAEPETRTDGSEVTPTTAPYSQLRQVLLPVCILIGLSCDGDAMSYTEPSNQLTSEWHTLHTKHLRSADQISINKNHDVLGQLTSKGVG